MMFIHQMGKDMFPYETEKNKIRFIRSVAVTVMMMIIIKREVKSVN